MLHQLTVRRTHRGGVRRRVRDLPGGVPRRGAPVPPSALAPARSCATPLRTRKSRRPLTALPAVAFCYPVLPQTLGALLVLTLPELVMAAEDETLMVGDDLEARARRFLEREMRARLFLSIMMSVFAIRGFRSVQSVDVQGRQAPVCECAACVHA